MLVLLTRSIRREKQHMTVTPSGNVIRRVTTAILWNHPAMVRVGWGLAAGPSGAAARLRKTNWRLQMRISSPALRGVGPAIFVPLRKVPFLEAVSCRIQLLSWWTRMAQ